MSIPFDGDDLIRGRLPRENIHDFHSRIAKCGIRNSGLNIDFYFRSSIRNIIIGFVISVLPLAIVIATVIHGP